jgi:hypothetical protein
MIKTIRMLFTRSREGKSMYPNVLFLFSLFLVGTLSSAIVHSILTSFPLYISIVYSVILSFFFALANTTTLGTTGFGISLPYLWHTIVYYSDYRSYSGWVIQPVLAGGMTPGMLSMLKAAYLTETNPIDVIKGLILGITLSTIIGTVSLDLFWRMAPIPSSIYPFTTIDWARIAIGDSLLVTRQINISLPIILASALFSAISAGLFEVAGRSFGLPLSGPGLVAGFFTLPPYSIAIIIGSIIGNLLLPRIMGRDAWNKLRGTVVGGLVAGYGIAVGFTIALFFVLNSGWVWPW